MLCVRFDYVLCSLRHDCQHECDSHHPLIASFSILGNFNPEKAPKNALQNTEVSPQLCWNRSKIWLRKELKELKTKTNRSILQGLKSPLPAKLIPIIDLNKNRPFTFAPEPRHSRESRTLSSWLNGYKTREKPPPCDGGYAPHSFANLSRLKAEPNVNPHLTIDMLPMLSPTLVV